MQIIFKDIIAGDLDAVRRRLTKNAEVVSTVATSPPKKYLGQSPLQVAYRHGEFEIAALLLAHDADPNFIEHDNRDPWAIPVLHHAITAAVMRSRWLRPTWREENPWRPSSTTERAEAAHAALQLLLESGADAGARDSYGNSSLERAVLDARKILPTHRYNDPEWVDPKPLNPELVGDLTRIFKTLKTHGADPNIAHRTSDKSIAEFYRAEAVGQILLA